MAVEAAAVAVAWLVVVVAAEWHGLVAELVVEGCRDPVAVSSRMRRLMHQR